MDAAELRRAIEEPAQVAGLTLEERLVEDLLRDVGAEERPRARARRVALIVPCLC